MNEMLIRFRESEGMTQREFSEKLGLTLTFYSKIELGVRNPSYNFLVKFKKAFPKESVDHIFFENKLHEKCIEAC